MVLILLWKKFYKVVLKYSTFLLGVCSFFFYGYCIYPLRRDGIHLEQPHVDEFILYLSHTDENDIRPTTDQTWNYISSNDQESVELESVWRRYHSAQEVFNGPINTLIETEHKESLLIPQNDTNSFHQWHWDPQRDACKNYLSSNIPKINLKRKGKNELNNDWKVQVNSTLRIKGAFPHAVWPGSLLLV